MRVTSLRFLLPFFAVGFVLLPLLGAQYFKRVSAPPVIAEPVASVFVFCTSVQDQWIIAVVLGVYFAACLAIQNKLPHPDASDSNNPGKPRPALSLPRETILLILLVGIASARYGIGYASAVASGGFVVFLLGMTLGQAVRTKLAQEARHESSLPVHKVILPSFIIVLGLAAFFHPDMGVLFYYRERIRWTGPWDNPNTFGILMGVGFILSVAACLKCHFAQSKSVATDQVPSAKGMFLSAPTRRSVPYWVLCLVFLVGLAGSYSRGAWLASACGLSYLLISLSPLPLCQQIIRSACSPIAGTIRTLCRRLPQLLLITASVGILGFWNLRNTEIPLIRRAFSLGNQNDFSWRNRVTAAVGSLQMMGDRPWTGLGWNQPEVAYNELYRPFKLIEGMAIFLNDYFMLGMTLGIPALVCLLAYVWKRFTDGHRHFSESSNDRSTNDWDGMACRAAFLVLLIGFVPEHGLFCLATGVPFWILLELGAPTADNSAEISATAAGMGITDPNLLSPPRIAGGESASNASSAS